MNLMRRILGILVMIAGILGLVLSLAGLIGVWAVKPTVEVNANTTIDTLNDSVTTSQNVMEITVDALGATIESVDALSEMLGTTAATVEDTKPVLEELDTILAVTVPTTLESTTDSLYTAQEAAQILESTLQSLDTFRVVLSGVPLVGDFLPQTGESYNPEKPLADLLGEMATSLEGLPDTFVDISANLSATGENLESIQGNLVTMSDSVGKISSSLSEYEKMVTQSKSSMDNLASILADLQKNLPAILNGAAIVLSLFLAWLLAAQIVILSQGWELYQGTADRMESDDGDSD